MDSAVGGGIANEANGPRTTVAGGYNNIASDSNATVGGGYGNLASGSQSTIGGGKQNTASGICSTIGSGYNNTASGNESTVGGGLSNTASALRATVGGGDSITASGLRSTISGGYSNTSGNEYATVAGGSYNQATGKWATIPGGRDNQANADYSFAAGYYARVRAADSGALIWADSTGGVLESTGTNQFLVRASGGTKIFSNSAASAGVQLAAGGGSWSTICDRNAKDNFASVDGREVLDRLASIPIETWNYKSQDESIRHIGPMAQDFAAAFGVGESDTRITTVDADGVALAAIQGLYQLLQEQKAENAQLLERLEKLERLLAEQPKQEDDMKRTVKCLLILAFEAAARSQEHFTRSTPRSGSRSRDWRKAAW